MNNDNSISVPVHRLDGLARKQWWQTAYLFCVRKKEPVHPNQNHSIRAVICTLTIMPIYVFMAYQKVTTPAEIAYLAAMFSFAFLSLIALISPCVWHHIHHVLEVKPSDLELQFTSPGLKRRVPWHEIDKFFLAGSTELGFHEYAVVCKNGEVFYLSKDLTDSDHMFNFIQKRLPPHVVSSTPAQIIPDGQFDTQWVAAGAILLAGAFAAVKLVIGMFQTSSAETIEHLLIYGLIYGLMIIISIVIMYLHRTRFVQILQLSNEALFLRTRSGSTSIPWEQITAIQKLPGHILIKSKTNMPYIMMASQREPRIVELISRTDRKLTPIGEERKLLEK